MWVEDLPETTYDPGPLLQSAACRGHMQIAGGVNRAPAAIEYVTDTTLQGDFGILMSEVSTGYPTDCSSTYGSSRFIFWYSGMSLTPSQSFSLRKELKSQDSHRAYDILYHLVCQEPRIF